jgi:RNA polymerase sigma-70 factor (ECF subfamily)
MQLEVGAPRSRVDERVDFDDLYAALYPRLVRQLFAFTGDLTEAQDCVQEAFTRAYLRWGHVSTCDSPEAWVRTVAMRHSVSRWRKTRNAATAWRRHGAIVSPPDLSPDHVAVVTALRKLPAAQREAIVLHHLVGMSVAEISASTGAPSGTVKARLSRGRMSLAEDLGMDGLEAQDA